MTRTMPQALDSEETVLGAVLLRADSLDVVTPLVAPEDFYHPGHRAIYAAMRSLAVVSKPVDSITVCEAMRAAGTFDMLRAFDGEVYFATLMDRTVTVENVGYHARRVHGKAQARRLIEACQEIAAQGYGEFGEVDEYLANAARQVGDIAADGAADGYRPMREIMRDVARMVEQRYDRKQAITGLPTGLSKLDTMTGGFQPGHLVVIAGRPKMGKTALAMSIVRHATTGANACRSVHPALVISLEMSSSEMGERAAASEGRVDSVRLRNGFLDRRDWINFTKAATTLAEAPIHVFARPATFARIRAEARRWRTRETRRDQIGLIVVDYVGLIQPEKGGAVRNRQEEVAAWARGFKALAGELGCVVVLLAQLNRDLEKRADKRPMMSDLRESGALEQDADLIGLVYRPSVHDDKAEPTAAELIIDGHRHGPTGMIPLRFEAEYVRFVEA